MPIAKGCQKTTKKDTSPTTSVEDHPKAKGKLLGGGNSKIFYVHPDTWGEMIQFEEHIFSNGLKPPT